MGEKYLIPELEIIESVECDVITSSVELDENETEIMCI